MAAKGMKQDLVALTNAPALSYHPVVMKVCCEQLQQNV